MKVLVVGSGFTGCSLARLLADDGHQISIKEKLDHIGGLCYSKKSPNGILYEPYGAHVFHTMNDDVKKFVQRFAKLNSYIHHKGIKINGILRHYPISINTIKKMPECDQILKELDEGPKKKDPTNFETYMISVFGSTLYKLFIYNYTKKMWDMEPRELAVELAVKRMELCEFNTDLFNGSWQGVPIRGYTRLFKQIISGIPIEYNVSKFKEINYDIVLFSGKIDELFEYKFGVLPYRSLRFDYSDNDQWENEKYGTINLPQHPKYIRKANFKILHQQKLDNSWVQYQEPVQAVDKYLPMYPINTKENYALFNRYLNEACKSDKIIPVGRLGLYKYLDMDKAILLSMNMVQLIEKWINLSQKSRYLRLKALLKKY